MRISLVLVLLAACSLDNSSGDDTPPGDDAPLACTTPNPGCGDDDELCPGDCGDERYRCVDGAWVMTQYCEQCVGVTHDALDPATWRFTQTLGPVPACDLALRAEVVLAAAESAGYGLMLTPEDPALEILSIEGGLEWNNLFCWPTLAIRVNDVVQLDGVDAAATIDWDLDFGRTTFETITGTFTGVADGCAFSGTIAGTHDAPPPS